MRTELQSTPLRRAPSLRAARGFLRDALQKGAAAVTFRAPVANVMAAWPDRGDALLWDPPEGPALAGVGIAQECATRGQTRFQDVDLQILAGPELREAGVQAPEPRLFGGFAFACDGAREQPWAPFGDGLFVLPRWVYGVGVEGAFLRFHGASDPLIMDELTLMWARLSSPLEPSRPATVLSVQPPAFEPWRREVDAIRREIHAGRLEKVVSATHAGVHLDTPADPRIVIRRLRRRFVGCTCFAMRRGATTFLGATPEQLLSRRGAVLHTEALAGSVAPGRAKELMTSRKDRHEHVLVVDAITAALAPHASAIHHAATPSLHRLPNVVHLRTSIEARVEDVPTLTLVEALHPTPAVGGVPRREALEFIAAHEGPRGWYAAPFGWVDAQGDGTFVVALRSGVLHGHRAWAYAGCGIVEASEPRAEHDEATLKLGAFLGALGE